MKQPMKIVNVMNFVRQIDERTENSTEKLLAFTARELALVNEYGVDNTFLLQYDALCDPDFVDLFRREATGRTELGLWYEIVEPLTSACGLPYRSEAGWKWDWHIIPGFSMAYEPAQRDQLIDEAMRKFREVFGYYPKTVGSWVLDTRTFNRLASVYGVSAAAICRDQANTDAYTLLGGYSNGAYYPSKYNIFTPAQTREAQTGVPVFRLLGPCPIHNYDNHKYSSDALRALGDPPCFTLEPAWFMGRDPKAVRWMFDTLYGAESLGFAYAQIGQENSFFYCGESLLDGLRMQLEQLIARPDVRFLKMGDTGDLFRAAYPDLTPPTAVAALDNFDSADAQSVWYNCKNYTANLFRFEDRVFIRSLFLFDERVPDAYLDETCATFDAVYENLPIVDTRALPEDRRKDCGLTLSCGNAPVAVDQTAQGVLRATFGGGAVTFFEDRIEVAADSVWLDASSAYALTKVEPDCLFFSRKGRDYRLRIANGAALERGGRVQISGFGGAVGLIPAPAPLS